jgi:hypothetical protein
MGVFYQGIPPYIPTVARDDLGIALAVETGTYRGDSALSLAETLGRCITIEIYEPLAEKARARFAADDRIRVEQGSSRDVLPQILATLDEPALFWLDGHWSGVGTGGANDICPVDGELEALRAWKHIGNSIVAIDDARLFGFSSSDDPDKKSYPSILSIATTLDACGLELFWLDDVMVGFPKERRLDLLRVADSGLIRQDRLLPKPGLIDSVIGRLRS